MKKDKVSIKYTHPALVCKMGVRPIQVSRELANIYKSKGFAVILNESAETNVIPEKEESVDETVNFVRSQVLTKLTWVANNYVDKTIRDVGTSLGFDIKIVSPEMFSPGLIIRSDVLMISTSLLNFPKEKITQVKSILFQQKKSYCLYVDTSYDYSSHFKHLALHSNFNIFTDEIVMEEVCEDIGGALEQGWFLYSKEKVYDLWKEIGEI
jgi:hypothetical protein